MQQATVRHGWLGLVRLKVCAWLLVVNAVLVAGCGYHTDRFGYLNQRIDVSAQPSYASLTVKDKDGKRPLGLQPKSLQYSFERQATSANDAGGDYLGYGLGLGLPVVGLGIGGLMMALNESDSGASSRSAALTGTPMLATASACLVAMITMLAVTAYFEKPRVSYEPSSLVVEVTGEADGYEPKTVDVHLPLDQGEIKSIDMVLVPLAEPRARAAVSLSARKEVVAVDNIEDKAGVLPANLVAQLSAYLAQRINHGTGGLRIIPPGSLRSRLAQVRTEGYRDDCDESCQIELGKLAVASKLIVTKLIRVGTRCTLFSTLYDLKTDMAMFSVDQHSGCSPSDLQDAMDALARKVLVTAGLGM